MSGQAYGSPGLGYDPWREEHVVVCLRHTRWCFVSGEYSMECAVWPLRDLHPRMLASPPPIPAAVDVPPVHIGEKMYWPGETRAARCRHCYLGVRYLDRDLRGRAGKMEHLFLNNSQV